MQHICLFELEKKEKDTLKKSFIDLTSTHLTERFIYLSKKNNKIFDVQFYFKMT